MHVEAVVLLGGRLGVLFDLGLLGLVLLRLGEVLGDLPVVERARVGREPGDRVALQAELLRGHLGERLFRALGLEEAPLVDARRLRLRHRLHDVAVLHVAERHERRAHGDERRDGGVELARALLGRLDGLGHGVGDLGHAPTLARLARGHGFASVNEPAASPFAPSTWPSWNAWLA